MDILSFPPKHHKVLILGGGVAGVIAARSLHDAGIDDFLIVEARDELGGRLKSTQVDDVYWQSAGSDPGAVNSKLTLELGANWIEGVHSSKSLRL